MFEVLNSCGGARRGRLFLNRGQVETPVFMPVGTLGSVKTLVPEDLNQFGAEIMLSNTYHLFLRPGMDVIKHFKGLHNFINWQKPILTDSGGFQIFSLSKQRKITREGAHFKSHLDGQPFLFTPELAVEIQETLGSDIHMVLDECQPYPISYKESLKSLELTSHWAERSRKAKKNKNLMQFGIVQGSTYPDLRRKSMDALIPLDFEGYSIGGLSVGEPKPLMREMTKLCCEFLPKHKPRYLMGVGTPLDLIESVALGVDMFDCVMPTRNGRNGCLFTSKGKVSIKNSKYRYDETPLDENCSCYTCKNFSKAYLRHLFKCGELTALRLFSLHNISFYLNFMKKIRASIENGSFRDLLTEEQGLWAKK
ncbi:MAG: tRNA guanosine(34) transglycosylase Tgt [Zetaproteobacteria bacterium]|nr:tRNA guanosine(34) transglycosylase Tgt [Pseudobdellovibrionaceae bacterium]